jgi:protease-4
MNEMLTSSCWALETKFFALSKSAILARLEAGLPALDASESKPRQYSHMAEGYPTMWVTQAQVPAKALDSQSEGLAAALNGFFAAAQAGRGDVQRGNQAAAGRGGAGSANTSGSKVAVIPVQGTVQKRGGYCSLGTKDLVAHLQAANRDPEISAIVLDIDSPGGQVNGTEELAQAVALSGKPVVAYIDGLGASAAYWIASQASYIFINSASTGYAGSLGVLCMSINQSDFLAKQGLKVEILRSSRATDKARMNGVEEMDESVRASVQADLDQIGETFIAAVEQGRAGKLSTKEDVFTGKVYRGSDALKYGLVDKVGALQDAVNRAAKLAQTGGGKSASLFTQNFNSAWQISSPVS